MMSGVRHRRKRSVSSPSSPSPTSPRPPAPSSTRPSPKSCAGTRRKCTGLLPLRCWARLYELWTGVLSGVAVCSEAWQRELVENVNHSEWLASKQVALRTLSRRLPSLFVGVCVRVAACSTSIASVLRAVAVAF
eukprot:2370331-Rhodomonas_salina.1